MTMNINDFCPLDEYIPSTRVDGQDWFFVENIRRALQNQEASTTFDQKFEGIVPIYSDEDDPRLVSEDNFYRWVLGSENPAAERFQSWVMRVVMPTVIEDRMYMFGEEDRYPTPACDDEELLFWRGDGILDDEMELAILIEWWDYVIEILKEIRRDGGYLLDLADFTDDADPMRINRQLITKSVTKKVERRARLQRAVA